MIMKSTGSHIFKPMLSGVVLVGLAIFAATPATAQGMLSCTPTKMKQVRGMIDYAKEIKAQPQLIQSAERRYGFARKYQNEPRAIGNPCEKNLFSAHQQINSAITQIAGYSFYAHLGMRCDKKSFGIVLAHLKKGRKTQGINRKLWSTANTHYNFAGGAQHFSKPKCATHLNTSLGNIKKALAARAKIAKRPKILLRVKSSGKCLDMTGNPKNGVQLWQWTCNRANVNQQFFNQPISKPWQRLRNVRSNRCIDVAFGSKKGGAKIVQWDCYNNPNQMWKIVRRGGGWVSVVARHSNMCLDLAYGKKENRAVFIQWPCNPRNPNQLFQVIR
jgi:hypothetical protein